MIQPNRLESVVRALAAVGVSCVLSGCTVVNVPPGATLTVGGTTITVAGADLSSSTPLARPIYGPAIALPRTPLPDDTGTQNQARQCDNEAERTQSQPHETWMRCMGAFEVARNPDFRYPDLLVTWQTIRQQIAQLQDKGVVNNTLATEFSKQSRLWLISKLTWRPTGHPPPGKTFLTPPDGVEPALAHKLDVIDFSAQLDKSRPGS